MKNFIIVLTLVFSSAVHAQAPDYDVYDYQRIDPWCLKKAPPIQGEIVLQVVRVPSAPKRTRFYVCYNGVVLQAGPTRGDAWEAFVQTDLIPRLKMIHERAQEAAELADGASIWQY